MRTPSRSADSSTDSSSWASSSGENVDVRLAQARHRGLDPGQRGAQVVGDRGEERGASPVVAGQAPGPGRLDDQAVPRQQGGGVRGERADETLVVGGQDRPDEDQLGLVVDGLPHARVRDVGQPEVAGGGHQRPRVANRRPRDQGGSAHTERRPRSVEERRQRVRLGEQRLGEGREHARLALRPERDIAPTGRAVDHRGHRRRDDDEHDQRDRVLRALDRQRPLRVGEEPVDGQGGHDRAEDRREESADERGRDGEREEQQHLERQLVPAGRGDQRERDESDADGRQQPAPQAASRAEPVVADAQAVDAAAGVADEVDVDVARRRGDLLADTAPRQSRQRGPAAGAEDDLRGVDAAGEVEDRLGDVAAGDLVHHAAQLLDQLAVRGQGLRVRVHEPVGSRDVAGEQLAAGAAAGDLGGPAQHGLALRPAGQRDDDPLPRGPGRRDAVRGAVALQRLLDAVGQPEQGQLAQRRQVARPEVVGQRGVDPVGRVDVAVRHAAPQRLGRHVDELDLVGGANDVVRDGLPLHHAGDGLHDVVEGLEVLDVDRGDDVDAGIQEDVDVLPPLRSRRARGVRMRELVDQGDLGSPGDHGVDVELGQAVPRCSTVRRATASRPSAWAAVNERPWVSRMPMTTSVPRSWRRRPSASMATVFPTPGAAPR